MRAASPTTDEPTSDALRDWNATLNRTHAMAALRADAGHVVRTIEARRRRLVGDAVRRLAPAQVVDVGCEDGWIAEGYVDAVEHLVLVDIDPAVLDACALATRSNVTPVVADVLAPEPLRPVVGPEGADVIVLSAILEHLPDPARALATLVPFVCRGGHVVVYVPADRPILWIKGLLKRTSLGSLIRGLPLEPAPGHLHIFDRASLAALLRPFGSLERLSFDPLCLGYVAVLRVGTCNAAGRSDGVADGSPVREAR